MTDRSLKVLMDPKHKLFADAFLISGKISESARKAGYSPKGAHVAGNRLLKRPDVQAYLAAQASKVSEQTEDLQAKILRKLEAMTFSNIEDFIRIDDDGLPQVDFSTATREQLQAITSVASKRKTRTDKHGNKEVELDSRFTMADPYRGAELLGKHLGMFKEAEQRVVVDVADRLLNARKRMSNMEAE